MTVHRRADYGGDIARPSHIAPKEDRAIVSDLIHDFAPTRFVDVREDDERARGHERLRRCSPDSRGAARDDPNLTV
ncbi:hypothetical protein GCM10009836_36960 [Pseudonocardia ailaonensis]|uniref:Rhodanese domain-containing protein n=1 Tax=Pseudonocardia ailaonensis TaxID=367279 RepID=A0ABN2N5C5_9PSEU